MASALASYGRQLNRSIRSLFGAPVSFRPHSDFAGTWSGVGVVADFPSQELKIPWLLGERASGRVMVSHHFVGVTSFMIASIYGFPSSPTWPRHRDLTEELLTTITKEVVIGAQGCRIIQGDFNQPVDGLQAFQLWRHYGWVEAQCLANHRWGRPISATRKNSTTVDHLWLSPEAAMLCVQVGTFDVFADHQTVFADFQLPTSAMKISRWPMPSPIDWTQVDVDAWHAQLRTVSGPVHSELSANAFYATWANHCESSLDGHLRDQPQGRLPSGCKGRAQISAPRYSALAAPIAKPSRQGEVALKSNLLNLAVHQWFRQLRRLQSFTHSAAANKCTVNAEAYRLELWQAIKRAPGFSPNFVEWWIHRSHKSPQAPATLPMAPPSASLATAIFLDFKLNFERFEAWQLRQKVKILQSKYDDACHALFRELRDPGRDQLDFLWDTTTFAVLDFCPDTRQIHLDRPVPAHQHSCWKFQHVSLKVQHTDHDLITVATLPATLEVGDELRMHQYFTSLEEIHQALIDLWRPRCEKFPQ